MDPIQAVVLALLQGLTELLPISSSGHLILTPVLLGWPDHDLGFDIAVHLGTLCAVIVYFRRDIAAMARSLFDFGSEDSRLVWQIIVATVPLGLAGLIAYVFL